MDTSITHTLAWQDQEVAMLASCNGVPFPPGNAPVLSVGTPIGCPKCHKAITLVWDVYVKEISDQEAETLQKRAGIIV